MSTPLEVSRKLPIKKSPNRKAASPFHTPQKLNEVELLTGSSTPIIYIVQDIERATGIENLLERYAIVVPWESDLSRSLGQKGTRVFVLERDCREFKEDALKGGTYGMMKLPCVKNFIEEFSQGTPAFAQGYGEARPHILVLKNSELIEQECAKNGWKLLAPQAHVAKLFEDKITQWELLHEVVQFPETVVTDMGHAAQQAQTIGFPLIMQFNAGHSGGGTHIIKAPADFAQFAEKFPRREVRLAQFIQGTTYTLNALVSKEGEVFTGSLSKQLTGLKEATANPSSTVGNDWGAAAEELSQAQGRKIADMAKTIGKKMREKGYAGLFGIDVVAEKNTDEVYCIEVNTHQPASISFEAKLHQKIGKKPLLFLWIRGMIKNICVHPRPHQHSSASADELPPLFLKGNARQIIYRNKTGESIPRDAIQVPEGAMASRMKNVLPNEELYRVQTYDIAQ